LDARPTKKIAVKFESLSVADEANLRAFIQRELVQRNVAIDAADTAEKMRREVFRVVFNQMKIKIVTEATAKVPQSQLEVSLEDLSEGGCCIGVAQNQPIVKGVTIYLTLHFCQPSLSVRGTVLGLRRD
jgi:hypothetical protein